jgi:hypothetical protein
MTRSIHSSRIVARSGRVRTAGRAAARPYRLHARFSDALTLPMNFMHAALIQPVRGICHQSGAHRIFLNIKPFFVVTLPIPKSVVKATPLKRAAVGTCLCQLILPEPHPTFDGKFQVPRRAEQMQMVRHQQIIAHQPGRCLLFPNVMQRPVDGGLCQPTPAFIGANRQENPIGAARRDRNAFGGCVPFCGMVGRRCGAAGRTRGSASLPMMTRGSASLPMMTRGSASLPVMTRGSASLPVMISGAGCIWQKPSPGGSGAGQTN